MAIVSYSPARQVCDNDKGKEKEGSAFIEARKAESQSQYPGVNLWSPVMKKQGNGYQWKEKELPVLRH